MIVDHDIFNDRLVLDMAAGEVKPRLFTYSPYRWYTRYQLSCGGKYRRFEKIAWSAKPFVKITSVAKKVLGNGRNRALSLATPSVLNFLWNKIKYIGANQLKLL